jgi:hypothetical protein
MDTPHATPPPLPRRSSTRKVLLWIGVPLLALVVLSAGGLVLAKFGKTIVETSSRAQRNAFLKQLENAAADSKQQVREAFNEENGLSPEKSAAAMERFQQELGKAEQNLSGEDARVAGATRKWLGALQDKTLAYSKLVEEIDLENTLDFTKVERPELATRKKNVQRMLAANNELRHAIEGAEASFESELVSADISKRMREEVLSGYRQGARRKHEMLIKVRATDAEIGDAAIQILDLMDREWGKWQFDAAQDQLSFNEDEPIKIYGEQMGRIQKASEEQIEAQRLLVQ